jgi:hypothetical protein
VIPATEKRYEELFFSIEVLAGARLARAWLRPRPNKRLHLTPGSGVPWLGTTSVAPAQVKRSVGRQRREGKNSKDDLFMQEEMPA